MRRLHRIAPQPTIGGMAGTMSDGLLLITGEIEGTMKQITKPREAGRPLTYKRSDLGQRIRDARRAAGLTATVAAAVAGVNCGQWSDWETGRREPKIGSLVAIAKTLQVSVDALLGCDFKSIPRANKRARRRSA